MKAVIEVFPDRERLVHDAAEHLVRLSSEAVAKNGRFVIALSGGSTPRPLYGLLASERYMRLIEWSRVHLFWGDERCVPPDDPRSNYGKAREALLEAVPLPPGNIHRIRGEDDPEVAAAAYERARQAKPAAGAKPAPSLFLHLRQLFAHRHCFYHRCGRFRRYFRYRFWRLAAVCHCHYEESC
jgi:6-phosphogluconolactonase